MACCAFAVFLLVQLLAPFSVLRRYFFGAPAAADTAAVWRLGHGDAGGPGRAAAPRRRRLRSAVLVVVSVEAVALGGYLLAPSGFPGGHVVAPATAAEWDAFIVMHTLWCGDTDGRLQHTLRNPEAGT